MPTTILASSVVIGFRVCHGVIHICLVTREMQETIAWGLFSSVVVKGDTSGLADTVVLTIVQTEGIAPLNSTVGVHVGENIECAA